MASAEQMLNEAQYAFNSISFGESRDNRRNAARARSLSRKIIRKFPASTEAATAQSILRRLGDEAFTSNLKAQHQHSDEHVPLQLPAQELRAEAGRGQAEARLNWGGLLRIVLMQPLATLILIGAAVFILVAVFGAFLWLPLIALLLFSGSLKRSLNSDQSQAMNKLVARINAYVAGRLEHRN